MFDMKRLKKMQEALYGVGQGRTTAALAEALERLTKPDHRPVLLFVVPGLSATIDGVKETARSVAEAIGIPGLDEKKDALFVGDIGRELRFVTSHEFMHGADVLVRFWGGGKTPSFVADPAVLEQLWILRRKP